MSNTTDIKDSIHEAVEVQNLTESHFTGNDDLAESHNTGNDDHVDNEAQPGVQDIEAVTLTWTTTALISAYVMIWLVYFIQGALSGTQASLLPYVTSNYASHSLLPTVNIISSIIGGCTNFTIAKILDVFGRPQGFLFCIIIGTLGLIMMAATQSVELYAAALVFYTVGNTGLQYTLSVFVADTSSLHNRGLIQAIAYSPNMITCWLAGPIATGYLNGPGWPWAFGTFAILVPVVTLPLYGLLKYHYTRAKRLSVVPTRAQKRRTLDSIWHYAQEFDAVGLLLLSGGVALTLLPFNLYLLQPAGWASPLIICLLVFGVFLLGVFVAWEKFYARCSFIPFSLLTNRTVLGACFLSATLFFNYFCWYSFFGSFLQVVNGLDVTLASYVVQTYTVGSVIFSLLAGVVVHYTGRFKWVTLFFAIPLSILGTGLMIYFSGPSTSVGFLVMCQVFLSVGAGVIIISDEIAMLATTSHQHIAVVLATLGFFGNLGGAIGLTVTGAIWQNAFPAALAKYLPADQQENLVDIFASIDVQLSYPQGSPTRVAIQKAYGDAQSDILIAATAAWAFGFIATLMWRNIKVTDIKQTKGNVF